MRSWTVKEAQAEEHTCASSRPTLAGRTAAAAAAIRAALAASEARQAAHWAPQDFGCVLALILFAFETVTPMPPNIHERMPITLDSRPCQHED